MRVKYIPPLPNLVRGRRPHATVPRDAKCFCGAPATRWDGGYQGLSHAKVTGSVVPAHPYRCDSHDPHHKWFDVGENDRS